MITTSTEHPFVKTNTSIVDEVVHLVENGDLILFPSDTLWSVGCDMRNPVSLIRLSRLNLDHDMYPIELLVSSLDMLKHYVHHLHPRLETLLVYHRRPLSMVVDQPRRLSKELEGMLTKTVFRVVTDGFLNELIERLGYPLASTFAYRNGLPLPINLGVISSDILEKVDKVINFNGKNKADYLSVMVELSEKGELNFLRE